MQSEIPDDALLRVAQICNRPSVTTRSASGGKRGRRARAATQGVIPVSPSCWWRWVDAGFAPKPRKLGGATVWTGADIKHFIAERLTSGEPS